MVGQFLAPFSCPKNLSYKYNATVQNDLQHNTLKSLRTEQQIIRLEKGKKRRRLDSAIRLTVILMFLNFCWGPCMDRQKLQSRLYFKSSCGVLGKVFNQQ